MNIADKIVVVGGSAGSIPLIIQIVASLSQAFVHPLVIIIHRQKNTLSNMDKILGRNSNGRPVVEPEDKQPIVPGYIYLAPQNYHLLIEDIQKFSLDYSELVHYCRPAIDVTFQSAAAAFKQNAIGILLSGANADGTNGITEIIAHNGLAIVQTPATAEYPLMPQSALTANTSLTGSTMAQIIHLFKNNTF